MNLPSIIGISGKMGSGKSTFAKHLNEEYPQYTRASIGDAVKKACADNFHFPLSWCYTEEGKNNLVCFPLPWPFSNEKTLTVRQVLQWWGTDIVREMVDENHWIRQLADQGRVIIDDIRFKNEARYVKDRGGVLIRIENYEGKPASANDTHISETDLDDFDGFDLILAPQYGQLQRAAEMVDLNYTYL